MTTYQTQRIEALLEMGLCENERLAALVRQLQEGMRDIRAAVRGCDGALFRIVDRIAEEALNGEGAKETTR